MQKRLGVSRWLGRPFERQVDIWPGFATYDCPPPFDLKGVECRHDEGSVADAEGVRVIVLTGSGA